MSDVFISYQREDKVKAQTIAEALVKKDYSVWWDRDILPGGDFENVIKKAIDEAKCVIVLWSKKSILSGWVKDEADKGKNRNILIPILIEEVEIPMGFGRIHAARLVDWQGNLSDPEFSLILKSVSELVKSPPVLIKVPAVAAPLAAVPPITGLIDNSFLFSWDDIPGNDNQRLIEFLKQTYGIDWARTANIEKIDDGKTIKLSIEKNSLSFSLNIEKTKVNLIINDVRVDEFIVKLESGKLHIKPMPKEPDYYFKRGIAFLEINDPGQAIPNFEKAIILDQNQAEYYFQLGKSHLMKDNPDLAIKNFNKAIQLQLNLEKPDFYLERGKAYFKINDYDRAIKNHTKAIGLDPNKGVYYFERGRSFSRKEDYENAISDLNRAILLDPGKADYYLEQGMCYEQKADLERAISNFNRAIQIDPNNSYFYLVRGKINMLKADYTITCEENVLLKKAIMMEHFLILAMLLIIIRITLNTITRVE
jgi:tetratricopeptide (TPR) repeat protein